ncbi:hypothetical protein [Streptomyces sp. NPDC059016]|uniref:hypothetical protein n=1 Tax=Streptomyces sp. NPDC059016 TaxID=3346699 RepID=UPI0036AE846E
MSDTSQTEPITYHWIMTAQAGDGRMGTFDGPVSAVPGVHTQDSTYQTVCQQVAQLLGTDGLTVFFYSLTPNQI